jgi:hypothetical protein
LISKFIESFEGVKGAKGNQKKRNIADEVLAAPGEVKINFHNQVSGTQGPKTFRTTFECKQTIDKVLECCALQINPSRDVKELSLTYRGKPIMEILKSLSEVMGPEAGDG